MNWRSDKFECKGGPYFGLNKGFWSKRDDMGKLLDIKKYRLKKKREWTRQYKALLDHHIASFIGTNITIDYIQISSIYQAQKQDEFEASWDYAELREKIRDALDETIGDALYQSLKGQNWFNPIFIGKEEAIDRCLSAFILSSFLNETDANLFSYCETES
ncbi:MAG: hypothetical protein R3B45_04540 [Bdellovibrionota bacterium]